MADTPDTPDRLTDIRFIRGRPLDGYVHYQTYSARIDGKEFFFDIYSDYKMDETLGYYDMTIERVGRRALNTFGKIPLTAEQKQIIIDGISAYFRIHGRLPTSKPPRKITFKNN